MAGFSFSASDILKVLDSVPLWKSLVTLPKRVAELEARLAALEKTKADQTAPAANACPRCSAAMVFQNERPHPTFGRMGVKLHEFKCDGCGFTAERRYDPGKNAYT
ncbi:hypothetical protein [Labrenzia sp. OB1]|uniref:hypothetical protein n=1 Tax=Labrenzia sp. OB1 TaxID=1561204 RepID=UPI0007B2140F|nr:hypothetical protein [Labrenzia sp. OB1]KZM48259.1 hypothetical protein OA90_21105 [Labrenzia sp. OB1]